MHVLCTLSLSSGLDAQGSEAEKVLCDEAKFTFIYLLNMRKAHVFNTDKAIWDEFPV